MASIADLIAGRLRAAGVTHLFGVPGGGSNLDLIAAAERAGIRFVLTATETGGAIAAVAQSELTGRPGACITTLGPGVTSVVNGVACARLERAPLVVLTDSLPASAEGVFRHQRIDAHAVLGPVAKWSVDLDAGAPGENVEAVEVLDRAIAAAMSFPRGPVHVGMGSDHPIARSPDDPMRLPNHPIARSPIRSRHPLLLVGLGARQPSATLAIRALCARHAVPAMVTYKAKGVVPDHDRHFAGVLTNGTIERPIIEQADMLIAVGLDPVELLARPWPFTQPTLSLAAWPNEASQIPFITEYVGDLAALVAGLSDQLTQTSWDFDWIHDRLEAQRNRLQATRKQHITPDRVIRLVAAAAPESRVTVDAGAHMLPATMLWPVDHPGGMLISNGLSTMGFAVPAAIGAALSDPDHSIVALTGDGGLLMCAGELLTLARERLQVMVVVFNDASLSLIDVKQRQRLQMAGKQPQAHARERRGGSRGPRAASARGGLGARSPQIRLGSVRWARIAEGFGMPAFEAATGTELQRALECARRQQGPSLIDAHVDPSAYSSMLEVIRG